MIRRLQEPGPRGETHEIVGTFEAPAQRVEPRRMPSGRVSTTTRRVRRAPRPAAPAAGDVPDDTEEVRRMFSGDDG